MNNYVYDLILNWSNREVYNFFEWDDSDDFEYIKKIPIVKINNFFDIDSIIKVKKDFLDLIHNKTIGYFKDGDSIIEYACVFVSSDKALAVEFNSDGISSFKSNIYILDLEDVLESGKNIDSIDLDYEVLDRKYSRSFLTRLEDKKKNYLINEINNSSDLKIKFMYYEVFNKYIDDYSLMKSELINSLNNYSSYHDKLYSDILEPYFL